MENHEGSSVIGPFLEKEASFQEQGARNFFSKWCEVNDGIVPQYLPREEWKEKVQDGVLQKDDHGAHKLYIPEDLKLWEIMDIVDVVDRDTFGKESPEKRRDMADYFINMGIYIARNMDDVKEGKDIALETVKDFYRYGNSIRTGKFDESYNMDEISSGALSKRQTEDFDHLFAIDKLAQSKKPMLSKQDLMKGKNPSSDWKPDLPTARKETISHYFKAAHRSSEGGLSHKKAIGRVEKNMLSKTLRKPEVELDKAVLERGVEHLVENMGKSGWDEMVVDRFKEIGIDLERSTQNLREILDTPGLKKELDDIRETGDIEKISKKERDVALKIQKAISRIPYMSGYALPSVIAGTQSLNCVGATLMGGKLLEDVGINYLVGSSSTHSLTLLVTSDKKVYFQDFLHPEFNSQINDHSFIRNGNNITAKEVAEYCAAPGGDHPFFLQGEDLFILTSSAIDSAADWMLEDNFRNDLNSYLVPHRRGSGDINYKYNLVFGLVDNKRHEEAIEIGKEISRIDPKTGRERLAYAYAKSGEIEKATEILLDEKNSEEDDDNALLALSILFENQRKASFIKALEKNPKKACRLLLTASNWIVKKHMSGENTSFNFYDVLDCLDCAASLDPENSDVHKNKALLYAEVFYYDSALEESKSFAAGDESKEKALNALVDAISLSCEKSVEGLKEAIGSKNESVIIDNFPRVYSGLKKLPEGLADFRSALAREPKVAVKLFGKTASALLYGPNLEKNVDLIKDLLGEGQNVDPKDARLYSVYGALYERLGEYDKALEKYEKAHDLAPLDPTHQYDIGRVYLMQGRDQEAIAAFQRSTEMEWPEKYVEYLGFAKKTIKELKEKEKADTA